MPPSHGMSFQPVDLCNSIAYSMICGVLDRVTKGFTVHFSHYLSTYVIALVLPLTPESKPHRLYLQTGLLADMGREAKNQSRRRARAQLRLNEAPPCLSVLRGPLSMCFSRCCAPSVRSLLKSSPWCRAKCGPWAQWRAAGDPSGPSSVLRCRQCTSRCL